MKQKLNQNPTSKSQGSKVVALPRHGSASRRYYFSSAGYICDSHTYGRLGRLQDKEGWRDYGAGLCEELNASPHNAESIIEKWSAHLEPNVAGEATASKKGTKS